MAQISRNAKRDRQAAQYPMAYQLNTAQMEASLRILKATWEQERTVTRNVPEAVLISTFHSRLGTSSPIIVHSDLFGHDGFESSVFAQQNIAE